MIRQTAGLLGLGAREIELYQSLKTLAGVYSEIIVKSPFGSGVARLVMDPLANWISTSDMSDRTALEVLIATALGRGREGREALREGLLEAARLHPRGAAATPRAER